MNSPTEVMTSRARLIMCSVDLPARALLLNMRQYNGQHGCVYYEDDGTPRLSSHLHRNWPYTSDPVPHIHAKMLEDADKAVSDGEAVCTYNIRMNVHTKCTCKGRIM